MRIRTGFGPNDWTPNVPANARSVAIRGALVVGASGSNDPARQRDHQRKHAAKVRASVEAAITAAVEAAS